MVPSKAAYVFTWVIIALWSITILGSLWWVLQGIWWYILLAGIGVAVIWSQAKYIKRYREANRVSS